MSGGGLAPSDVVVLEARLLACLLDAGLSDHHAGEATRLCASALAQRPELLEACRDSEEAVEIDVRRAVVAVYLGPLLAERRPLNSPQFSELREAAYGVIREG